MRAAAGPARLDCHASISAQSSRTSLRVSERRGGSGAPTDDADRGARRGLPPHSKTVRPLPAPGCPLPNRCAAAEANEGPHQRSCPTRRPVRRKLCAPDRSAPEAGPDLDAGSGAQGHTRLTCTRWQRPGSVCPSERHAGLAEARHLSGQSTGKPEGSTSVVDGASLVERACIPPPDPPASRYPGCHVFASLESRLICSIPVVVATLMVWKSRRSAQTSTPHLRPCAGECRNRW